MTARLQLSLLPHDQLKHDMAYCTMGVPPLCNKNTFNFVQSCYAFSRWLCHMHGSSHERGLVYSRALNVLGNNVEAICEAGGYLMRYSVLC